MATSVPQLDDLAIRLQQNQQPVPASIAAPLQLPDQTKPDLSIGATPHPQVIAPRGTIQGDQAERSRMLNTGAGEDQIQGKLEGSQFGQVHPVAAKILGGLGQGLAKLGDVGLSAIAPALAINLPGTEYHHMAELHGLNKQIGSEEGEQEKEARTANLESEPALHQAQAELGQQKLDETQRQHDEQLREHGFKMDDKGQMVPLEYSEMSESQQAVHDLRVSQDELAQASTALKEAQKAGIPAQIGMAQQRIQTAQQNARTAAGRLGISAQSLAFREKEEQDKLDNPAIPQVAQGRAYQGRAILESASDLKGFIDKNPEVFGNLDSYWKQYTNGTPISNPAASKAMAKIASFAALQPALHGMRSHQAMQEFERMIGGIPKNPDSLKAAIDGLTESAAQPMVDVGTPHPRGSTASGKTSANDPLGIR